MMTKYTPKKQCIVGQHPAKYKQYHNGQQTHIAEEEDADYHPVASWTFIFADAASTDVDQSFYARRTRNRTGF